MAIEELRRSSEINPKMRERAAAEEDLSSLRGVDGSPIE
jgi:hypothetical protein